MANRPNLDSGQLAKTDKILADIVSKFDMLDRMDEIPMFKLLPEQLDDVDKKLASVNKAVSLLASKNGQKRWKDFTAAIKANRKETEALQKTNKHLQDLANKGVKLTKRELADMKLREERIAALNKEYEEELNHRKALKKLAAALNSAEVKKFIEGKYNGAVVPAF